MVVSTRQSFTATLQSGRPTLVEASAWLQRQRRRLWILRVCGWIVLLVETWVLIGCWQLAATRHGAWKTYLWSLAAVLAWFHGLAFLLDSWLTKVAARVNPRGDRWQIGRYSEAELRQLIHEATDGLPSQLRRLSVCIADVRSVAAWTWLNAFWPRADRKPAKPAKSRKLNQELNEFVEQRRGRQVRRIRWRRFDGDGDGVLAAEEIARLCEALITHPDYVLVTSREECESTTHPSCRDRLLVLNLLYPACPPVTLAKGRYGTTVT